MKMSFTNFFFLILMFGVGMTLASAQGIDESFDDVPLVNNVGELPDGWVQYNVDGNTPNASVAYMGSNAWVVRQIADGVITALSTSWYTPAAASDDWMVTPKFEVDSNNSVMLIEAVNLDGNFADQIEVYVSVDSNLVSDFTDQLGTYTPGTAIENLVVSLEDYVGQAIYVGIRNNSQDKFLLAIDRIYTANPDDFPLEMVVNENNNAFSNRYTTIDEAEDELLVEVENRSINTVESLDILWIVGSDTTPARVSADIGPLTTEVVSLNVPIVLGSGEEVQYDAIITSEDIDEGDLSNNVVEDRTLTAVDPGATKYALIEEATGTWCQWCPRGFVAVDKSYEQLDDIVVIAVHGANNDPMQIDEYLNALSGVTNGLSFPSVVRDRYVGGLNVPGIPQGGTIDDVNFSEYYNDSKALVAPVEFKDVVATIDGDGEIVIDVNMESMFSSNNADINLAAVIKQDGLTGTGQVWGQVNRYSSQWNGPSAGSMDGWENLPTLVTGYAYDHVAILMLGGYEGVQSSFPAAVSVGMEPSYEFVTSTNDFPSWSNGDSLLTVVVMAIDATTNRVLNSTEVEIEPAVSTSQVERSVDFRVFPTTASDQVTIDFGSELASGTYNLAIYDMAGKRVVLDRVNNPSGEMNLNVAGYQAGQYIVELSNTSGITTKSFIKL